MDKMKLQEAYIVAALRTPVCKAGTVFAETRPDDLLAHVLKAVMNQVGQISPEQIDEVIVGCAMPEAQQGMNVARISTLLAGLPDSVPAMTINRFCASGLEAIALSANRIQLGEADIILAAGVESMSMVPMGGFHFSANPRFFSEEGMEPIAYGMGVTAEKVASKWGIGRDQQDAFALESHVRASKAIEQGRFQAEVAPITVRETLFDIQSRKRIQEFKLIAQDHGPRRDTSLEVLSKLRPVFHAKGTVTAGNSSQRSDGAAAILLVSEKVLAQYDLHPLARFMGYSVAGVAPEYMGIGPVAAIPKILSRLKLNLQQIQWIELNEAFAAQSLAVMKDLSLDPAIVNPVGSAIALGHPLGATGAIRTATLIHGMRQHHLKYGMVTMCIGTGMGAAGIFEIL
ncbi:MAG: acetyl-CoA C-acyltransferase [Gammaproteobacteria bacterium]